VKNRIKLFLGIPAAMVLMAAVAVVAVVPLFAAPVTVTTEVLDTGGSVVATTVGGVQYVSAQTTTSVTTNSRIKVTIVNDQVTGQTTTATVTNTNGATGDTFTLTLSRATTTAGTQSFSGTIAVATTTIAASNQVAGSDGNIIRIVETVNGLIKNVTVDTSKPTIGSLSPVTATLTNVQTIQFAGSVTDPTGSSGVRPSDSTGVAPATGEIVITVGSSDLTSGSTWTAASNGFTFSLNAFRAAGAHTWSVTAKDRVGNVTVSATQTLTIDLKPPALKTATTGWSYDTVLKKRVAAKNSIELQFTNLDTTTSLPGTAVDFLNGGSIVAADFTVDGVAPSSVIFPDIKAADAADSVETQNRVYLTLAANVASDGKPLVRVIGAISDKAGNSASTGDATAGDGVVPTLTVSMTGTNSTGRIVTSNATGAVTTVTVTSDEPLVGAPTISFSTLTPTTTTPFAKVAAVVAKTGTAAGTNTWTATLKYGDAPGASTNRLISVQVSGTDKSTNVGTSGKGAAVNDLVDINLANLFEFDNSLAAPTVSISPTVTGSSINTESTSPFIRIDFDGEGTEYSITDNDADGSTDSVTVGTAKTTVDTHDAVTLTKVTLNGVDVTGNVGSVDSNSFLVSTSGLAVGEHKVLVNAKDDVGAVLAADAAFTFNVVARSAHKITLRPGWNLVSFPGDPVTKAIDTVLAGNAAISSVLTYDPAASSGPWLIATRNATSGKLEGTLTEIDGTHAYWILTTTFDSVSAVLQERSFSTLPPTINIVAGWNLVPVANLGLAAMATAVDEDAYFASITWTVAYRFDTATNAWIKVVKAQSGSNLKVGEGWWVFATAAGQLVP